MIGLLYKDFVATKSKFFVALYIIQLILLSAVLLFVADDVDSGMMMAYLAAGAVACMFLIIIFFTEQSVMKTDSRKQADYYLSTPVSKYGYVASKYVFILIALILVTGISVIELAAAKNNEFGRKAVIDLWKFLPVIAGMVIGLCAIELPFYFGMGVQGGGAFKTGLLFALMFVGIAYLFFGDLEVLKNFSFDKIIKFLTQKNLLKKFQVLTPIIGSVMFLLSYGLSVLLFSRREKYM